jgi:sulfite reductase (ferredoxin)
VAELAEKYADGHMRATTLQNIVIVNVPEANIAAVQEEAAKLDLPSDEKNYFRRGAMACTGIQFCKVAVAETKDRTAEIVEYLQEALPEWNEPISINMSGCPNSCTRYQLADIGLLGSLVRTDGSSTADKEEVYQVYLGGRLGKDMRLGHHLNRRVPSPEVKFYIERILRRYLQERQPDDRFTDYVHRFSLEELEAW